MKKIRFRPWAYVALSAIAGTVLGVLAYPNGVIPTAILIAILGIAKMYDEYKKEVVNTQKELRGRIIKK